MKSLFTRLRAGLQSTDRTDAKIRPSIRRATLMLLILVVLAVVLRFTVLRPPAVPVAKVTRGTVAAEVEGTGTVTADVLANISSKITGRVERVFVDQGDRVRRGQVLAILDQTGLRHKVDAARARLAADRAKAGERKREWLREKRLQPSGAVGIEEYQRYRERYAVARSVVRAAAAELRDVEYQLSLTRIPALFDGIVIRRWSVPGVSVVPGQPMFLVADTNLIYVDTFIDQNFTGKIRPGQPATVILRGRENAPLAGRVLRIDPQADQATEEMIAEVTFRIPADRFQLGQWANVYIKVGEAKDALVVPDTALLTIGNHVFVLSVGPNNKIRRQPVTVLARSPRNPMVAIAGRFQPNERVALHPAGLRPGEAVRPFLRTMPKAAGSNP